MRILFSIPAVRRMVVASQIQGHGRTRKDRPRAAVKVRMAARKARARANGRDNGLGFEFRLIMKKWAYARQQLEERPTTWDAGINPGLLCHLLFSLAPSAEHGMEWVRPRCSQCHVNCPHERAKPSFVL